MNPSVNTMTATIPVFDKEDIVNYLPAASNKTTGRTIAVAFSGKSRTEKVRESFYIWLYIF